MATLQRAIEIAVEAHKGQPDKAGQPYILHPIRVMLSVNTENERMAAVLHDVVEDTSWTLEELRSEGFPTPVIEAVEALTKRNGETRVEAARRARQNPIARVVKQADVSDNMDLSRILELTDKDFDRLKQYKEVLEILSATDSPR